jgi:micrococcal nuclease
VDPARLTQRVVVAVLALGLAGAAGCDEGTATRAGDTGETEAVVSWVIDGDSLRLADGRIVRLVQIDAPEGRSDCYGRDATRALVSLTPKGTRVVLERDPDLDGVDSYDRLLRTVRVGATNVNLELVEEGAAAPYFFRGQRGRYAGELLDAAQKARREGRGLWGACPRARLDPGRGSLTGPRSTQRG